MSYRWITLSVAVVCLFQTVSAEAVLTTPILEYTLNSADNTTSLPAGAAVINTGSAGAPGDLTMFSAGNPGASTNFYSVDGGGVSGLPGDRAFNNTSSGAMGTGPLGGGPNAFYQVPNRGPRATNNTDNGILNNRTALTITGWVKTEPGKTWDYLSQVWAGDAGQFMNIRSADSLAGNGGKIEFDFRTGANTSSALVRSNTANWNLDNEWMFFAVSWDGSNGTVGMYYVDGANQVQSAGATYVNGTSAAVHGTGAIQDTAQTGGSPPATYGVAIGNQAGYALRPFDGWLDNMRVFDSVLDVADLQVLVNGDLAVPEPTGGLLLALGGAALAVFRRRRNCQHQSS